VVQAFVHADQCLREFDINQGFSGCVAPKGSADETDAVRPLRPRNSQPLSVIELALVNGPRLNSEMDGFNIYFSIKASHAHCTAPKANYPEAHKPTRILIIIWKVSPY
jgi:hypothetical protein